jgi:poly(beta-D-mannuronate) lyase
MVMRLFAVLAVLTVGVGGASIADGQTQPLQSPFDVNNLLRGLGESPPSFTCKSPPSSVRDLTFDGFYKHGSGSSVVDKKAMREYRAARKPIDRFARTIIKMSDRYLAAVESNPEIAQCVFGWLHHWAKGRAFLGEVSQQGSYVRKWALGTVSLAYLKIRKARHFDSAKQNGIKKWIADWAEIVRDDYSTDMHKSSRNNNHAYWASWSVGLAGVVLNNRSHFNWMVERQHAAMRQVEDDGTLPLEMKRRSKALHYHVYSAQVLVMIAALAARNGVNLYGIENGALHRLVKRTVDGLSDPAYFVEKTGKKQSWVGKVSGSKLAWMEAYYARFPASGIKRWIDQYRPMKNRRIGGNATLLYGAQ